MERKEKIYLYMMSAEYIPLTFEELRIALDVPEDSLPELYSILEELILEGRIFLSKKKRYAVCERNMLYPGILRCNARGKFGFVTTESFDDDIFVSPSGLDTAIDGDKVLVRVTGRARGRREGIVEKVLERHNTTISAVMIDDFSAKPDNARIFKNIKLDDIQDAKAGDRVLVELTDYSRRGDIFGRVISVLGSSRDLKTLTESIIFENGIKPLFDKETLSEADSFSGEISDDEIVGRCDLTHETIFTIDGDDARDFDDAVSIKILKNGNYELGVHIADVTHYVTEGSSLDRDAFSRGTSVYLADRVIPMLPKRLSNGLCSLNPHEKRLTLSVVMEITPDGEVSGHKLLKSVICSCERMTYDNVSKILDGDSILREKYAPIVPDLEQMHTLSKILCKRREERGSINFDFPESKILLDQSGRPREIVRLIRNDAHRLIEEFMLVANETVAEFAFWADIPFVYRVHEQPDSEKMEAFKRFIGNFGLFIKGREVYPKDLQQILDRIKDTDNETMIATNMLRSLMKAEYKPECDGHFGLAAKYYCHFTSPIRRYPDLIIHRILKDFLDGKDVSKYKNIVFDASVSSSESERAAELCERSVDDLFKTAYISDFVGAEFSAKVSGITNFGMFAELENTVEGLIRLETIDGDFYEFDEEHRVLVGKRHGRTYRIGDNIKIEVVRADLLTRQIDFVLKGSKAGFYDKRKPTLQRASTHRKYHKRGRKNGKI